MYRLVHPSISEDKYIQRSDNQLYDKSLMSNNPSQAANQIVIKSTTYNEKSLSHNEKNIVGKQPSEFKNAANQIFISGK